MRYSLTLEKIINETPEVKSYYFVADAPINFKAGQFLKYFLSHPESDQRGVSRYFTISSAPQEKTIMMTTKFVPGDGSSFKQALLKLAPGDHIEAEGPSGSFTYQDHLQEVVFVAGGIGITPFRAILVDLDQQNINPPITLLYANRTSDASFKNLFAELTKKHNRLKVDYVTGLITEDTLKSHLINHPSAVFYLSGPEPMVESLKKSLENLGLPANQIKTDYFPGYEDEFTISPQLEKDEVAK